MERSEHVTAVDGNDFAAALADPRVHELWRRADEYAESLIARGHCPAHLVVNCDCRTMQVVAQRDAFGQALAQIVADPIQAQVIASNALAEQERA